MAARIKLLQLAITVVNLSIVVLAFTSIWPFPSGDFKVDLPSAQEVTWTYADGIVQIHAPFSIDNGGFYDVDQLTISYRVTNYTHYDITSRSIDIGSLPAGTVTSSSLDFNFDLLSLYNSGAQWMVFNDDLLIFDVEVSCFYTMKLVKFEASYQVSVPWDALIRGYGITNTTFAAPVAFGDPMTATVTYWLNTADLLRSLPAAQVSFGFYANETPLGHAQSTVQLGGNQTQLPVTMAIDYVTFLATYSNETAYSVELLINVGGLMLRQTQSITASDLPGWPP